MAGPISEILLEVLVCPLCYESLTAGPDNAAHAWLHCSGCGRYYPVEDGIPVMLVERATRTLPFA